VSDQETSQEERDNIVRKRIANKVIWNLDDIQALVMDAWGINIWEPWRDAVERAEEKHDAVMLKHLALMSERFAGLWQTLARIERKVRDARQGEYSDDRE